MKEPLISIIIRTKNEEKYLDQVLESLKKQTFRDFEIIIVDNESTDRTLEIARKHDCKIVTIEKDKFTYPHACNVGIRNSVGKYIVFISGHSIPLNNEWLANGLKNFDDAKVAGVYGTPFALPDVNLAERIIYALWGRFFQGKRFVINKLEQASMGVLGFTNAMIRRDLWERYNINVAFAGGGEDGDWAKHWVAEGFAIIHDPKFKVYHSHDLGLIDLIRQFFGWKKMHEATEFAPQKKKV